MNVTHAVEHDHGDHSDHAAVPAPEGYGPPAYGPPVYGPHSYAPPRPNGFTRFFVNLNERAKWAAPASIALCFAGAASYVLVSNPTDASASDIPTCIVKLTTGLDCPGCGGTRAFYYLLNGNIPEAARHHAIAVFAAPFLVWLYVAWAVKHVTGRQVPAPRISAKAISLFLAVWAVFMVVRNIPIAPFTSLYV